MDVEVGALVLVLQWQEQRPGRQRLKAGVEVEGRVTVQEQGSRQVPTLPRNCWDGRLRAQGLQDKGGRGGQRTGAQECFKAL